MDYKNEMEWNKWFQVSYMNEKPINQLINTAQVAPRWSPVRYTVWQSHVARSAAGHLARRFVAGHEIWQRPKLCCSGHNCALFFKCWTAQHDHGTDGKNKYPLSERGISRLSKITKEHTADENLLMLDGHHDWAGQTCLYTWPLQYVIGIYMPANLHI